MILWNRLAIYRGGIDINISGGWYGLHYYWQRYPLFDVIYGQKKCGSIHEYGIIIFGLWLWAKVDK